MRALVPITNTGVQAEKATTTVIITSKEFGKMMQNLRTYACLRLDISGYKIKSLQLFLKNIADCKSVKTSIISDPCPVQVFETLVQQD